MSKDTLVVNDRDKMGTVSALYYELPCSILSIKISTCQFFQIWRDVPGGAACDLCCSQDCDLGRAGQLGFEEFGFEGWADFVMSSFFGN